MPNIVVEDQWVTVKDSRIAFHYLYGIVRNEVFVGYEYAFPYQHSVFVLLM